MRGPGFTSMPVTGWLRRFNCSTAMILPAVISWRSFDIPLRSENHISISHCFYARDMILCIIPQKLVNQPIHGWTLPLVHLWKSNRHCSHSRGSCSREEGSALCSVEKLLHKEVRGVWGIPVTTCSLGPSWQQWLPSSLASLFLFPWTLNFL